MAKPPDSDWKMHNGLEAEPRPGAPAITPTPRDWDVEGPTNFPRTAPSRSGAILIIGVVLLGLLALLIWLVVTFAPA